MPIKAGWNILKFVRAEEAKAKRLGAQLFDGYKFNAVNMATEEVQFIFVVPVGEKRGKIIDDLLFLAGTKQWIDVKLVEKKRILAIEELKEVKQDGRELEELKNKYKRYLQ